MSTRAQIKYAQAVGQLSLYLHRTTEPTSIPHGEWEQAYKDLQAVAKFWGVPGEVSWNEVVKQAREGWIGEARKDNAFKGYYKLRKEIDRLGVMLE